MKIIIILFLIGGITYSQVDIEKEKAALRQADIDFSNYSKTTDMRQAFLEYIADDGVLLRPYSYPYSGKKAVKELLESEEVNFVLTWEPLYADISSAADMGYTYGTFLLTAKDESGREIQRRGTYATFWKKNNEGKWKFVLDTGNPGLEPPDKK
jgi:ketosteroid isomerase-like protein